MAAARGKAAQPNFRFVRYNTAAPANEDTVCPEGKEKSCGTGIKSGNSGLSQQGRGRATSGLIMRVHNRYPTTSASRR